MKQTNKAICCFFQALNLESMFLFSFRKLDLDDVIVAKELVQDTRATITVITDDIRWGISMPFIFICLKNSVMSEWVFFTIEKAKA